jgi:NADPH:quinone reductase-like Zn-dependent oxidoreductase
MRGVVERQAADGTGPAAGVRVVGLVRAGAWAELAAVPVDWLAPIPDGVPDAQAATLPTAGMTALRCLELGGLLLGRRVLIAGANGGVGRIAVQLAVASGAQVTALVRDAAAGELDELRGGASASADLARLCDLVDVGRLDGQVTLEDSWRRADTAVTALLHGRVGGKVVLHVD